MDCFKNNIHKYKTMRDHQPGDNEGDDTFSLHGLPIYSHDSSDHSSNSISSTEIDHPSNDLFEFFTVDHSCNDSCQQSDNIVFCGKAIQCREVSNKSQECYATTASKRDYFGKIRQTSQSKTNKLDRASSINGSQKNASKIKWYSILFGLQKNSVPTRMNLDDMRSRQSKITPKSIEMLEKCNTGSNRKLDQGLSYLLRSLSCRGR